MRAAWFPAYTPETRRWESSYTTNDDGRTVALERRVPPCTNRTYAFPVDDEVLGWSDSLTTDGRFTVSRQLTLYPDARAASEAVTALGQLSQDLGCVFGGPDVVGSSSQELGPDRFFGAQDPDVLYSEGQYVLDGPAASYTYVDIVSVRENAVMWTRVGSDEPLDGPSGSVVVDKDDNPAFVEAIRAQADAGATVLGLLGAGRR